MLLFLLLSCSRLTNLETSQAGQDAKIASLAADADQQADGQKSAKDRLDAAEARLDAAEARLDATETKLADALVRLDAAEARLATVGEAITLEADRLDDVEGQQATDQAANQAADEAADARLDAAELALTNSEARLTALESAAPGVASDLVALHAQVDALSSGGGGGGLSMATATASVGTGGSGSNWAAIIGGLSVTVDAGANVVAFCVFTEAGSYGSAAYEATIDAADGSWSDTGEAIGDGTASLVYPGEAATAVGAWSVPTAGDFTVGCKGKYASPYDVSLLVLY